ncbi:MAG: hypothetical protein ABIH23_32795 [bacterium]
MGHDIPDLDNTNDGFDDIFGEEQRSDLSMQKFDHIWEKSSSAKSTEDGISPNQLVRFVHNGKVHWITQDEADVYLQLADSTDSRQHAIKKQIKRAIRGETRSLDDELSVLLAICASTLSRYNRDGTLPPEEIGRIHPSLQRRFQEKEVQVDCLEEVESAIALKRRREPIFEEYEEQMGQMLNLERMGKKAQAAAMARELADKKNQYVVMSRALQPDINATYYCRMELQKCKKRALTLQEYLTAQRENVLEEEIKNLQQQLQRLESEKTTDDGLMDRGISVDKKRYKSRLERIDKTHQKLVEHSAELESLEKESQILVSQIKDAGEVISYISEELLKETDQDDNIQQQIRMMAAKRNLRKPQKFNFARKTDSRMVTASGRRR